MEIRGGAIVKRIDKQRALLGLSRKDVAIAGGLKSPQSLTDWSKGSIPQADTAVYIADRLEVSVRWLLTGEDESGLNLDERNLVIKYQSLDDQGRFEVKALLDAKLTVLEKKQTAAG